MNLQAKELNKNIESENPGIFHMLSGKGRQIFYPKMGILGQSSEAKGKRINATIGMAMNDEGRPLKLDSISENINLDDNEVFPYAPCSGIDELNILWKKKIFEKNASLNNSEISKPVVCSGLTNALNICGFLFVDPDDEIILPDLYWGNYSLIFEQVYGAKIVTHPIFTDEGRYNLSGVEQKLNSEGEKKILILNFPNNPTGYTLTTEEAEEFLLIIKNAARKGKKIITVCDDAYFGLVFEEGVLKESLFARLANLDKNVLAVKIDGATKEDYAWGFRIGFITYGCNAGSEKLLNALREKTLGAVRASISSSSNLSQMLLIKSYLSESYNAEKAGNYNLIKSRYEMMKKTIDMNPRYREYIEPLPFNSGYFMCFRLHDLNGEIIRQVLLRKYDTGVIAIKNNIRIAYSAVKTDCIPELVRNLYMACKDVREGI